VGKTTPISTRAAYVPPTKTTLFKSSDSVSAYYQLESVHPTTQSLNINLEIAFTNPLSNEIDSALTVAFVCSRYRFCAGLLNGIHSNPIDISNVYRSLQLLNPVSDAEEAGPTEKVQQFLTFLQFLNLSISGPKSVESLEELQALIEQGFLESHGEDIVFDIPDNVIPPDVVVVESTNVEQATAGAASLQVKYIAHWGIGVRAGHFLPIIVHANGEVDALYHCVTNNHFGSMKSLFYSDIPIRFICYSIRSDVHHLKVI
jgi:hypothetical protein